MRIVVIILSLLFCSSTYALTVEQHAATTANPHGAKQKITQKLNVGTDEDYDPSNSLKVKGGAKIDVIQAQAPDGENLNDLATAGQLARLKAELLLEILDLQLVTNSGSATTFSRGNPGSVNNVSFCGSTTAFALRADCITLRDSNNSLVTINPLLGASYVGDLTNIISNTQTESTPNGRDTVGAFGSDIWVYFYWIWDGTTLASLSSASYKTKGGEGATLPTGYTHWCLAAIVRLTSSALPTTGYMRGNTFYRVVRQTVVTSQNNTTESTIDMATFIPPETLSWLAELELGILNNGTHAQARYNIRTLSGSNYLRPIVNTGPGGLTNWQTQLILVPNKDQSFISIWTDIGGTNTVSGNVYLNSYSIPNGG